MFADITHKLNTSGGIDLGMPRFLPSAEVPRAHLLIRTRSEDMRYQLPEIVSSFQWIPYGSSVVDPKMYLSRSFGMCVATIAFTHKQRLGFQHTFYDCSDPRVFGEGVANYGDDIAGIIILGNDTIYLDDGKTRDHKKGILYTGIREGLAGNPKLASLALPYIDLNPPIVDDMPVQWMDILFDQTHLTAWKTNSNQCFYALELDELFRLACSANSVSADAEI